MRKSGNWWYNTVMFNKTFYRFTMGFVGILLASFMLAAVVSHIDADESMSAKVPAGE